ncbi:MULTISPECIES: FkbM family methyltransferase [unclassified Pseudodesulfovibrio]|uniref:FkbM family methyltransferase n=1 Tax=unclassified Pseudodesulfovibrio TaxID=2661612 RepID=UPI0013E2C5D6|nr:MULTISPECIES: FkbM family methyltransferase [unclassified Pseudodesulfovibrio]MCJ2165648.1 FkbM family methyltransferase [Pseudodesulfovibrio sp. S3-i]
MLRPFDELQELAETSLEGPLRAGVTDSNHPFVVYDGISFFRFPLEAERHNSKIGVDKGLEDYGFADCLESSVIQILKDISFRHQANRGVVPHMHCDIKPGDVVVEVGAYLGYYSMWFCKQVGPTGHVFGIELQPDCHAVLEKNFSFNFPGTSTAINCGVLDRKDVVEAYCHKNHANSFRSDVLLKACHAPMEDFAMVPVRTDTLENLFRDHGVPEVKLLTIQVNGAEVEALKGLGNGFDKVENIFVAAPYGRDGGDNVSAVVEVIESKGFEVRIEGRTGVFARRQGG